MDFDSLRGAPPLQAWYHSSARVVFGPFPTVSLVGVFFEPTHFKSGNVRSPIIVNCPLSIVNFFPFPFRFIGQVGTDPEDGGGQEGHQEAYIEGFVLVAEGDGVGAL